MISLLMMDMFGSHHEDWRHSGTKPNDIYDLNIPICNVFVPHKSLELFVQLFSALARRSTVKSSGFPSST